MYVPVQYFDVLSSHRNVSLRNVNLVVSQGVALCFDKLFDVLLSKFVGKKL